MLCNKNFTEDDAPKAMPFRDVLDESNLSPWQIPYCKNLSSRCLTRLPPSAHTVLTQLFAMDNSVSFVEIPP